MMKRVRFIRDWKDYVKGQEDAFTEATADALVGSQVAEPVVVPPVVLEVHNIETVLDAFGVR